MTARHRIQTTRRSAAQRLGGVVCVLAFLLQAVLPASAQASGGMWVEICGEAGAELVLMAGSGDDTGPATPTACRECCPCVLTLAGAPMIPPGEIMLLPAPQSVASGPQAFHTAIAINAAQFWPDTRGPPLRHENTKPADLSVMAPTQVPTGGAMS